MSAVAGISVGAVVSLAPDKTGGTVAASQLRNWSPVYRQQSPDDRIGGIEDTQSGYKILHTKDSQYHRIAVVEDDLSRYLRFDSSFQSGMFKDDPYETRFEYSDYLQLPLAYRPTTRRILYIGLGGGSAPKRTWRDFPATRLDVVELDPAVVDVAYEYFELPRDRVLATRYGLKASDLVEAGSFGRMAALHGDAIVDVSLDDATRELKTVTPDWYAVAQALAG